MGLSTSINITDNHTATYIRIGAMAAMHLEDDGREYSAEILLAAYEAYGDDLKLKTLRRKVPLSDERRAAILDQLYGAISDAGLFADATPVLEEGQTIEEAEGAEDIAVPDETEEAPSIEEDAMTTEVDTEGTDEEE